MSGDILLTVEHFRSLSDTALRTRCIRREKPVVMVANHHWAAGRQTADLAEFRDEDWVMPGRELSPDYLDALTGLCAAHGFHPRIRHQVNSTLRQMAFAACGQGIALVPEWFAAMRPPTLSVVRLPDAAAVITLTAAWNGAIESPQRDAALRLIHEADEKIPL